MTETDPEKMEELNYQCSKHLSNLSSEFCEEGGYLPSADYLYQEPNTTSSYTNSGKVLADYNYTIDCDATIGQLSSPYYQSALYILYGAIFVLALCGNGLVCYVVQASPRMRTVTNYFIVNLAVGDILMTLLCIPFSFVTTLLLQHWPFGRIMCSTVSYSQVGPPLNSLSPLFPSQDYTLLAPPLTTAALALRQDHVFHRQLLTGGCFVTKIMNHMPIYSVIQSAMSVFVSAYTLVAISVDRYMAIMWPLKPRMSKTQAKVVILIVWTIAVITALPIPLVSQLIQPTEFFKICGRFICEERWEDKSMRYLYSMTLMVLQYIVPLIVLVFTYVRIAVVVWGKQIPGEAENSRDQRMARSKRKHRVLLTVRIEAGESLVGAPHHLFLVIPGTDVLPIIIALDTVQACRNTFGRRG
uniref:G-protein coupled receptors family 1 profile domain-containing protein n=1 Tax=Timema genevievae TaxID=629358 RepID=A0A7R9JMD6_TIMGE|nr:unnamed protein product [Timema genevievae]